MSATQTKNLSGGQAAVAALRGEGVEVVFGLIGSAGMELFDALYDAAGIRFIGVRDERSGVHIADGYARAGGRPGVMLAGQNGPGATNLITGLAQAAAAFSPVVALAGALSSAHRYKDAFQEVDQQSLARAVTKKCWTVTSAARVPEMVREAFRTAMAGRRGPVQLNLPRDVLAEVAGFSAADFLAAEGNREDHRPAASAAGVAAAVAVLRRARRPVIVAGGGIKGGGGGNAGGGNGDGGGGNAGSDIDTGGHAAALALAEALSAPIATSAGHGDAVPCGHPLYAGQVGPRGNPVASRLLREADVIVALGTRLGFNSTFFSHEHLNRHAQIIHIELEPGALGRYFPAAVALWADAATAAAQLCAALGEAAADPAIRAEVADWTTTFQAERADWLRRRDATDTAANAEPIQPAALYRELRAALPPDAAITLDAGTLCLQATDALDYHHPPALFTPLDFGLVGFSFACGLGVKLACPQRPVVSLMGDGGFGMTVSELSTAVAYGINTVTVVLNNQCWGAEKAYQRDFFGGRYIGADIQSPPFDRLAELYGAAGFSVRRTNEVGDALRAALTCGKPAVVEVAVDPEALVSFRRDSFAHRAAGG